MDRALYKRHMQEALAAVSNLELYDGAVTDILLDRSTKKTVIRGVQLASGERIECKAVVITTGTFLRGVIHVGSQTRPAGRIASAASEAAASGVPATEAAQMTDSADVIAARAASRLSQTFAELEFKLGRLKTGTPPRIDGVSRQQT